ncbi:MAG TPA: glucosaminidase domain-containing protein [Burkholderiaceae bacterium]
MPAIIETVFCKYPDLTSCLKEYAVYLTKNPRYASALAHRDDARAFAQAIAAVQIGAGPEYAQTIIGMIDAHNLTQFDVGMGPVGMRVSAHGFAGFYNRMQAALRPLIDTGSRIAWQIQQSRRGHPTAGSEMPAHAPIHVPGSQPFIPYVFQDAVINANMVWAERDRWKTQEGQAALFRRLVVNNAARVMYVKKFAGTDEALRDAIDARNETVVSHQDQLRAAPAVNVQPILDHLGALRRKAAGTDPTIRDAIGQLQEAIGDATTAGQNGEPMISLEILDAVEEHVMSYFKPVPPADAHSPRRLKELAKIKDKIGSMIEDALPARRDYVDQFAKESIPITEMRLFRTLGAREKGAKIHLVGEPAILLHRVQAAALKAEDPDKPITPAGKQAINNLLEDLWREGSVAHGIV